MKALVIQSSQADSLTLFEEPLKVLNDTFSACLLSPFKRVYGDRLEGVLRLDTDNLFTLLRTLKFYTEGMLLCFGVGLGTVDLDTQTGGGYDAARESVKQLEACSRHEIFKNTYFTLTNDTVINDTINTLYALAEEKIDSWDYITKEIVSLAEQDITHDAIARALSQTLRPTFTRTAITNRLKRAQWADVVHIEHLLNQLLDRVKEETL